MEAICLDASDLTWSVPDAPDGCTPVLLLQGIVPEMSPRRCSVRAFLEGVDCGQPRLLVAGGDEALEFLKPVLHQDHFGDRCGLPLFELGH